VEEYAMQKIAIFLTLIIFLLAGSCSSKSEEGKTAEKEGKPVVLKRTINNVDEFNQALEELGITVFSDAEFVDLVKEKPLGAQETDPPNVFKGVYKLSGTEYFQNEKGFIAYYKKIYDEKWKNAGWKDNSIPGTNILSYNPQGGDFSLVSFIVMDSDLAKQRETQEMYISLMVRK
jgi:hypothetical protein